MTKQLQLKLDAIIKIIDTVSMGKVHGNRERHNVDARQIYFKIVHDHLRVPISHSANYIGKNHATGIHALKQFKNFYDIDKELKRKYHNTLEMLEHDFDFDVERTDNQDLLDDYIGLVKKNNILQDQYDKLHENFEAKLNSALMFELDSLPSNSLTTIYESDSATERIKNSVRQTLTNRDPSLNWKDKVIL